MYTRNDDEFVETKQVSRKKKHDVNTKRCFAVFGGDRRDIGVNGIIYYYDDGGIWQRRFRRDVIPERGNDNVIHGKRLVAVTCGMNQPPRDNGCANAGVRSPVTVDRRVCVHRRRAGRILCAVNEAGNRPRFATVIINGPKVREPKPTDYGYDGSGSRAYLS